MFQYVKTNVSAIGDIHVVYPIEQVSGDHAELEFFQFFGFSIPGIEDDFRSRETRQQLLGVLLLSGRSMLTGSPKQARVIA